MANSRPKTTTDGAKALARRITDLTRRLRALELRPPAAAVITPPPLYAIQVKRRTTLSVANATETQVQFGLETPYFENYDGTMWPAWPDSMFDPSDGYAVWAPIEGLYGFRANYRYSGALVEGVYARTIVRSSGSNPVGGEVLPSPAGAGKAFGSVVGSAYLQAGEPLSLWLYQESGAAMSVQMGGSKDDIFTTGIVFTVWLIAPRT